jgi:HEPN domain-containing protein
MAESYAGWLRQAQRDLKQAGSSLDAGDFEWACFAAQQSDEKAVKAVFIRANAIAWGHSVSALLQLLPAPWVAPPELIDAARELDRHYIPARYPNAHPEEAPYRLARNTLHVRGDRRLARRREHLPASRTPAKG